MADSHKMVAHPLAAAVIGVVGVLHDEVFVVGQRVALHHVARAAPPLRFSSPSAVSKRRLFSHFEVHHQKKLETNCSSFLLSFEMNLLFLLAEGLRELVVTILSFPRSAFILGVQIQFSVHTLVICQKKLGVIFGEPKE